MWWAGPYFKDLCGMYRAEVEVREYFLAYILKSSNIDEIGMTVAFAKRMYLLAEL
jgi:hypothetical protein